MATILKHQYTCWCYLLQRDAHTGGSTCYFVIIGPMTCELFVSILIYRSDLQNLFSFKLHYESSIKSNVWSKFIDVNKQIIFFLCHKSLTTNRKWLILMHWIHGRSRLSWQILLLIRFLTDYGNISGWLVS